MKCLKCLLVILCLLINKLNSQNFQKDCPYDGQIFTYQRSYFIKTQRINQCTESFVLSRSKNFLELKVTDILINCDDGQNNLFLVDGDLKTADYCQDRSEFVFYSVSQWIRIVKKGKVEFKFRFFKVETIPIVDKTFVKDEIATKMTSSTMFYQETKLVSEPNFTCGENLITKKMKGSTRIIGGHPAEAMTWPWQTFITDGMLTCGASLINNQWLVTAAHCSFDLDTWYAYFSEININQIENKNTATKIKISKFIPHERFKFSNDYDIGMLKLSSPVIFSEKINSICLPNGRVETTGNLGIITGWGIEAENSFFLSPILNEVSIKVLPDYYCSMNANTSICAGEIYSGIHDACHGDSGGPFVMQDPITNRFYLAGVTSSGNGCKGRGIYVRISTFENWILNTIDNN